MRTFKFKQNFKVELELPIYERPVSRGTFVGNTPSYVTCFHDAFHLHAECFETEISLVLVAGSTAWSPVVLEALLL
jgi:hypothetical protein